MAYINETFYNTKFCGRPIPAADFPRLADIASDVIDSICYIKPEGEILTDKRFKRAVAYQLELLYEQGGVDAITGSSELSQSGGSESLGDYSVSSGGSGSAADGSAMKVVNGIPISPLAYALLEQLGLMQRWAYAGFREPREW